MLDQSKAFKMAEETEGEEKRPTGQKIMCFVSKKMVPLEDTVEIEYQPRKKVRVLPKYIKYKEESTEA